MASTHDPEGYFNDLQKRVVLLERRPQTPPYIPPSGWAPTIAEADRFFNLSRVAQDYSADALDLIPLLQSPFFRYTQKVRTLGAEYYDGPSAFLSANGWVTMRGLVYQSTANTANALIFTLPPGWRPQQKMMFPNYAIDSGAGVQGITVDVNGEVRLSIAALINTEHSLAGITFNVNAYTPLTLTSPFVALDAPQFGQPGIYKSPDGVVGLCGGVQGGTIGNTAFQIPAAYMPVISAAGGETHYSTVSASGNFAYSNINATGAYRPRISAAQHLSGAHWIASGTPLFMLTASLINGWNNYGGAFPVAQATRTQDGLVMLNGLLGNAGSAPNTAFILPPGWRPRKNMIFADTANDAFARIDIGWDGAVQPVQPGGVLAWRALDGITFQAEPSA